MFELRRARLLASAALSVVACAAPKPPARLSTQGSMVRVGKARPSANAREIGPVEGESGDGCAGFGTIGTYETAEADLRNRTAALGGDYAQLVTILPPHDTGARCPENRMLIRGVAYKTGEEATGTAAPSPLNPSAPSASAATACDPPCSPGYMCNAGSCVALCNPACGPGQVCRSDRLCVPGG